MCNMVAKGMLLSEIFRLDVYNYFDVNSVWKICRRGHSATFHSLQWPCI